IKNETPGDVVLNSVRMLDASAADSGWSLARNERSPGVVLVEGASTLGCDAPREQAAGTERRYSGTHLLAFADPARKVGLLIGLLTAQAARPDVNAVFRAGAGGTYLVADQNLYGRTLPAGQTLKLDTVYIAAGTNAYSLLQDYGDAVAKLSPAPVRKGATALWCSWYAHRMAMTEDLVLANAAVAAKHFAPLGLQIMQLDHDWREGDITGDWVANDRFPTCLKWLANQLQSRYCLTMRLWIAPTDVAVTSAPFQQHPDWMRKG